MKFLMSFRNAVFLSSLSRLYHGLAFHVAPSYSPIIRSTLKSTRTTVTSVLYASTITTTGSGGSGSSETTTRTTDTQADSDNTAERRTKQKIAIVGSGAVGCYYGGRLWEVGYDVSFYMRGLHYEKSTEIGLNITSVKRDIFIPPDKLKAYDNIQKMASDSSSSSDDEDADSNGFDWIIVALKSTAVSNIPELIYPLLNPNKTRVLCIMNGLIEDDIIKGLNEYHANNSADDDNDETSLTTTTSSLNCCKALYGGMALVCCNRINPAHIYHSYAGLLSVGVAATNPSITIGKEEEEAENRDAFVQLWEPTKIDIVYEPCLLAGRWRKNCWNLPFNGISVAMGGITVDKIVLDPALRRLAHLVMDETIAVANADIQRKHGFVNKNELTKSFLLGEKEKKQMFDLSDNMGPYKTSTMIDLIERNPMEVKYLFRKPVERAKHLGIPVPHLETLVMQIEAYQRFYDL